MNAKSALLIAACLVLAWLFGDWSSYPNLQEVYNQQRNNVESPGSVERSPEDGGLRTQSFSNVNQFELWQSETRIAYRGLLNLPARTVGSPKVSVVRSMSEKKRNG